MNGHPRHARRGARDRAGASGAVGVLLSEGAIGEIEKPREGARGVKELGGAGWDNIPPFEKKWGNDGVGAIDRRSR